jgi:predicted component of type VI protein secretion system
MYTFLFDPQTSSLAHPSLYHSIHHQLNPLQESLNKSTSPANAAAQILVSGNTLDINQQFTTENQPVYDLVYDPTNLTIRSSIPNIPDLGFSLLDPSTTLWSRVESLNIHHRLLSTYLETRSRSLEIERTCKTSRGWWVVWVRMSDASGKSINDKSTSPLDDPCQEAFLIRKASDHISTSSHARNNSGSRFFRDLGGASSPGLSDMGPGKLVEGLGLDARRYIENLLSLNR